MCNCNKMAIPILNTPAPAAAATTTVTPTAATTETYYVVNKPAMTSVISTLQFVAVILTIIISIRILFFNK